MGIHPFPKNEFVLLGFLNCRSLLLTRVHILLPLIYSVPECPQLCLAAQYYLQID
jgi:hypothetical protein